jgi:N-acetylglucosamine-6-phosphate deacetylase
MAYKIKISNGVIITPNRMIKNATLILSGEKILDIVEGNVALEDAIEIDAHGQYISPGFIDLHVHGGGGYDFMDATIESFHKIAEMHAAHGTTAMLPTTLTSDTASIIKTLSVYEEALASKTKGASFLGMHLEGPYFSYNQRGAQDPRYIRDPDRAEYTEILKRASSIARWSAAPELKGCNEFGRYLKSKGILASIAHTDATYEEVLEAHESGFSLITHLYSCMSGVTRRNGFRYAGVIESAYLIDKMNVEIIADGIHLPASLLKLVYKIKGPDKIILVTDAMRAAGMPYGESILGSKHNGLRVIVEDGVARLPDGDGFAGSVATADRLIRTMVKIAEVPLMDAVKMMTTTPASIMNVDRNKGSLTKGKDADIVIFDEDINISAVIIKGKIEYAREKTVIV